MPSSLLNSQTNQESFVHRAAEYLFKELTQGNAFTISPEAAKLHDDFQKYIKQKKAVSRYENSIRSLEGNPKEQFQLTRKWLQAYIDQTKSSDLAEFINEAAVFLLLGGYDKKKRVNTSTKLTVENMQGEHPVIDGEQYRLDYNAFINKLERYEREKLPLYHAFQEQKKELQDEYRRQLRLDSFKPRVLSSFVRNRLIDRVYLPLIGDNLAKQIGTAGENTRTDRMGMLLLISPPGYGKTTLMEYISNRLGLIFMKINGPAIGHHVTSLDPEDAPNRAARQELEKLNLSFEMGDNVMIYVDDIQHCHPEFLQKFISLCDAQRKIEGIWKGEAKTYDFRGRRVGVIMAGNPYTESGEKFQIPDMLANRADIYNLGDIIGDSAEDFKLSYIENALTSNSVLSRLSGKSMKDVYTLVKMTETGQKEGIAFEANHSPEELNEYLSVLQKLLRIRDVILSVNQEYIRSAAMADDYREEPPFKLQGSYRNMNKLAEKVVPIMNEEELTSLLLAHYEGEVQTLTSGAEANFLKLKELMGLLSPDEQKRWDSIKKTFLKNKVFRGMDEQNPVTQVVAQMSRFSEGLEGIKDALDKGGE